MRTITTLAALSVTACASEPVDVGRQLLAHVEVTVYGNSAGAAPVTDAEVAFVDPDGTGRIVHTGSDGVARGELVAGGSVTALLPLVPAGNPPLLSTVLDVQDGDSIVLEPRTSSAPPETAATSPCDTSTLVATYTNIDPARLRAIYLTRSQADGPTVTVDTAPTQPTTQLALANIATDRVQLTTALKGPSPGDQQTITDVVAGCASTYDVDLGELLPWVGLPSLDIALARLDIPLDGSGTADFLAAGISVQRGDKYILWDLKSPQSDRIELPMLPGAFATLMPRDGDVLHAAWAHLVATDAAGRVRTSYRIATF